MKDKMFMRAVWRKKCLYGVLVLFFPLVLGASKVHKFYVSVTQITFSQEESSLQFISRIFIDDLEALLQTRYKETLVLDPTKDATEVDGYLAQYFDQKLQVTVDGKEQKIQFLGKKYEDDLVICYLEIKKITNPTIFEIENQVLFDLFDEQQNIIHVKKNNERKSLILEKEKPKGVLKFSE